MNVYNSHLLNNKKRWLVAIIVGIIGTIIIGIIFGYINRYMPLDFEILYILVGYLIGALIKYFGKGVQNKFSILAAILTLIAFLIADNVTFYGITILINPFAFINTSINIILSFFNFNLSTILSILFRIAGVFTAYQNARFL